MTWTSEPPKEEGWYWVLPKVGERHIVKVYNSRVRDKYIVLINGIPLAEKYGEMWAGPIPEPPEE